MPLSFAGTTYSDRGSVLETRPDQTRTMFFFQGFEFGNLWMEHGGNYNFLWIVVVRLPKIDQKPFMRFLLSHGSSQPVDNPRSLPTSGRMTHNMRVSFWDKGCGHRWSCQSVRDNNESAMSGSSASFLVTDNDLLAQVIPHSGHDTPRNEP